MEIGLSSGDPGSLSIRPEKLHIFPDEYPNIPAHMTRISALVNQVIYVGTDTRYIMELPDGFELVGRQQNTIPGGGQYRRGDRVSICWDPEHARILKE
jgi:putative spermidine/putrescine transport system ATP-binding protein